MAGLPPLPEPGFQSTDDRRAIGRRFISQARNYPEQGDRLQAGEKAWGAIAHNLKAIGELRGWRHDSHRLVENIGRQIVAEALDTDLGEAISDVYRLGHENFYENLEKRGNATLRCSPSRGSSACSGSLAARESQVIHHRFQQPLRRLIALTGKDDLPIGDSSPSGFSLKHLPDSHDSTLER